MCLDESKPTDPSFTGIVLSNTRLDPKDAVDTVAFPQCSKSHSDLMVRFVTPLIGMCADFSCFETPLTLSWFYQAGIRTQFYIAIKDRTAFHICSVHQERNSKDFRMIYFLHISPCLWSFYNQLSRFYLIISSWHLSSSTSRESITFYRRLFIATVIFCYREPSIIR